MSQQKTAKASGQKKNARPPGHAPDGGAHPPGGAGAGGAPPPGGAPAPDYQIRADAGEQVDSSVLASILQSLLVLATASVAAHIALFAVNITDTKIRVPQSIFGGIGFAACATIIASLRVLPKIRQLRYSPGVFWLMYLAIIVLGIAYVLFLYPPIGAGLANFFSGELPVN